MDSTTEVLPSLERFRSYLHLVTRQRLQGEQQKRIDPCAVVQQTLLAAEQQRSRCPGNSLADQAAWLRKLLAHNLGNAFRTLHSDLDDDCPKVSRIPPRPPSDEEVPNESASAQASAKRIAEALLQLPEAQREALVLQYWYGMTLKEIGGRLNTTPVGVAGLLKRGLSHLRRLQQGPAS